MGSDEPLRTSPTTAIALLAVYTVWIGVSIWLQFRGGQLLGTSARQVGYGMVLVAVGLPGSYMLRYEQSRLLGVGFCLGAVVALPVAFPRLAQLRRGGLPVGLVAVGLGVVALAAVALHTVVSDPDRLPVTRIKFFLLGLLAAAVVIVPVFTVFVPAVGTHPVGTIGYAVGFAAFYVVKGSKTGAGTVGTFYHRHRSVRHRAGDFALCATVGAVVAVTVSTAVASVAGSLAVEIAALMTAQSVTGWLFGLRRPEYESVAAEAVSRQS